jgi:hypothetical protein
VGVSAAGGALPQGGCDRRGPRDAGPQDQDLQGPGGEDSLLEGGGGGSQDVMLVLVTTTAGTVAGL